MTIAQQQSQIVGEAENVIYGSHLFPVGCFFFLLSTKKLFHNQRHETAGADNKCFIPAISHFMKCNTYINIYLCFLDGAFEKSRGMFFFLYPWIDTGVAFGTRSVMDVVLRRVFGWKSFSSSFLLLRVYCASVFPFLACLFLPSRRDVNPPFWSE